LDAHVLPNVASHHDIIIVSDNNGDKRTTATPHTGWCPSIGDFSCGCHDRCFDEKEVKTYFEISKASMTKRNPETTSGEIQGRVQEKNQESRPTTSLVEFERTFQGSILDPWKVQDLDLV